MLEKCHQVDELLHGQEVIIVAHSGFSFFDRVTGSCDYRMGLDDRRGQVLFGQNRVAGQLRPHFTGSCGKLLLRQFDRVASVALHFDKKLLPGVRVAVGE